MHKHKPFTMAGVKLAINSLNMPSVRVTKDVSIEFKIHQPMKRSQHYLLAKHFQKQRERGHR